MIAARLRAPLRRVRFGMHRLAGHALVLLYHRVTQVPLDPQWLSVTPERFAEHLEILRQDYYTVSLGEMQRRLRWGFLPHNTVVVTFDDGYADNLHRAKPLLEHFDVPATLFLVSGKVGKDGEFWWDELERTLLEPQRLPDSLSLFINCRTYSWQLGEKSGKAPGKFAVYKPQSGIIRWNVTLDSCPTPRYRLYRELVPLLKELEEEVREIG